MKIQTLLCAVTLLLSVAVVLPGCKKDKQKTPDCKLVSAQITGSTTPESYTFSYNADNKVNQIMSVNGGTTSTTTLTYSGNKVNVSQSIGGAIINKTVLTLNSAGRILLQEQRDPNNDTLISTTTMTYNGNGELLSIASMSGGSTTLSTIAMSNGNIVSMTDGTNLTTLEYYTDQAWRAGDYIDILQRLQLGNNFYLVNKNLIKSLSFGTNITNFTYTFDDNNNISSLQMLSGGAPINVSYQHQCQ